MFWKVKDESTETSDWLNPIRPDQSQGGEGGASYWCGCYSYLYLVTVGENQSRAAQQVQKN